MDEFQKNLESLSLQELVEISSVQIEDWREGLERIHVLLGLPYLPGKVMYSVETDEVAWLVPWVGPCAVEYLVLGPN